MVLHHHNFEIPARFSFQPYSASWRIVSAETVEWVEEAKFRPIKYKSAKKPEKTWLRVRVEVPDPDIGTLGGIYSSATVRIDRASIPPDVLAGHENPRNAPDVSGRWFRVLICQKPEFKNPLSVLKAGEVTKNAWVMRDEFLNLEADPDPELGWDWSVRQFLNRWGIWDGSDGFNEDWAPVLGIPSPSASLLEQKPDRPGFVLVMPHLLKEQQTEYRKALLPSNARPWLRSHLLTLDTADIPPFFFVRRSYCSSAIEATITIDHLADRQFGICRRCHKIFAKKNRHKKRFCSERCFNAAGVQRWREKQRKALRKAESTNKPT